MMHAYCKFKYENSYWARRRGRREYQYTVEGGRLEKSYGTILCLLVGLQQI